MTNWKKIYERFEKLPYQAQVLACSGAMLTGGVVSFLLGKEDSYNDIDFVVPVLNWRGVGEYIKVHFPDGKIGLNKFGGLRIEFSEKIYDIWPIDLLDYLGSEGKAGKELWVLDFPAKKLYHSVNLNT